MNPIVSGLTVSDDLYCSAPGEGTGEEIDDTVAAAKVEHHTLLWHTRMLDKQPRTLVYLVR
jgi:hypothetical protein